MGDIEFLSIGLDAMNIGTCLRLSAKRGMQSLGQLLDLLADDAL